MSTRASASKKRKVKAPNDLCDSSGGEASSKPAKVSPNALKKDAYKLIELISGDGVDFVGVITKLLRDGDTKTIQLLKSMYPVDEVKECLLCGEECIPGSGNKCSLKHEVDCWHFSSDMYDHYRGCRRCYWSASCSRCGESFGKDGHEDDEFDPDDGVDGLCYHGKHAFTKKEKDAVLEGLEDSRH